MLRRLSFPFPRVFFWNRNSRVLKKICNVRRPTPATGNARPMMKIALSLLTKYSRASTGTGQRCSLVSTTTLGARFKITHSSSLSNRFVVTSVPRHVTVFVFDGAANIQLNGLAVSPYASCCVQRFFFSDFCLFITRHGFRADRCSVRDAHTLLRMIGQIYHRR